MSTLAPLPTVRSLLLSRPLLLGILGSLAIGALACSSGSDETGNADGAPPPTGDDSPMNSVHADSGAGGQEDRDAAVTNDTGSDAVDARATVADSSVPPAEDASSGFGRDAAGAEDATAPDSGGNDAAPHMCGAPQGAAPPTSVTVNASTTLRTIPDDLYGYNAEVWNGYENGSNTQYNDILANAGFKVMRWMGGSWGDSSAWNDLACIGSWVVTYQQSSALYRQLGIRFQPIANGSSDRTWCNTSHAESDAIAVATSWVNDGALGAKYWEVGNELYGNWEQGATTGSSYGSYFADYYQAMKAANPAIQVLAVGLPQNQTCGDCVVGDTKWTSDLLKAAYAKGVVPDGFQIHTYPGDANTAVLHSVLDAIGTYTSFLNTTVKQITGHGQLAYAMTEFGVSGDDSNGTLRFSEWVNAEFTLQYVLEMAKNGWAASNTFGQLWGANFRASPTFYVYAFLYGKFGRDLVSASSSSADVRAYASIDATGHLTVFLANNATSATTVRVNVAGYNAACSGQLWVLQGANGGGQAATDIDINGTVHPAESSARTMSGTTVTTGGAFDVQLPASSLGLVSLSN